MSAALAVIVGPGTANLGDLAVRLGYFLPLAGFTGAVLGDNIGCWAGLRYGMRLTRLPGLRRFYTPARGCPAGGARLAPGPQAAAIQTSAIRPETLATSTMEPASY